MKKFITASIVLLLGFIISAEQPLLAAKSVTPPVTHQKNKSFEFTQNWHLGLFGHGMGKSGFVVADIDNNTTVEIVCGASTTTFGENDYWYVVEYDSDSSQYVMRWISYLNESYITSLAAFDLNGDGVFNIYLGTDDGNIQIYDGETYEEVGRIDTPASSVNGLTLADADNDGQDEIVFCNSDSLFVYGTISQVVEYQLPYGSSDFAVGDVDADPAQEIVFADGRVLDLDAFDTTEEWLYIPGFGYHVELSDIDSDNMLEIIAAESWNYITAFDADLQSPKWQINTDLNIDALLLKDINDDGIDEVIYGDGQFGEVHCHSSQTQAQMWEIPNPSSGVTDIAIADADLDGTLELIWGCGSNSTEEDHLSVYSIPTQQGKWLSSHVDGPFAAVDIGDADADGRLELVCVSFASESGYEDGIVYVFDADTHTLEWSSPPGFFNSEAWTGLHDVKIGDVDDDHQPEIVVATDRLYEGAIYVIDGATHLLEQQYIYDDGAPIYCLAIADVDNDDQTEIVAGAGQEHSGAPGIFVYVINGATGAVEWNSINLGGAWSRIDMVDVGDVDGDNVPEICVINDYLYIIDGISHQQWMSVAHGFDALTLYDNDGDSAPEIFLGQDSWILALDGSTHDTELNLAVSTGDVQNLWVGDLDPDRDSEAVVSDGDKMYVVDLATGVTQWQSADIGSLVGVHNALAVSDVDNDGLAELVVGALHQLLQFKSDAATPTYLVSFFAERQLYGVQLWWQTAYSFLGHGFHVWRAEAGKEMLRVSTNLVEGDTSFEFFDGTAPQDEAEYWLQEIGEGGIETWFGPASLARDGSLPSITAIERSYPNPFNPTLSVDFTVAHAGPVNLAVYDLAGRKIRTLVAEVKAMGRYSTVWNGQTDHGIPAPSGIYLLRLTTIATIQSQKIVLAR